ncbi:hypothetical protein [Streptomyces sp. SID8499]|uniref:hypothetical protein n=1 Tax=Streptomyces sp. SID8499 TaxID=2706106 RepID=UPI0013CA17EE|nr:hypothetical protein [Streptomyces sp. SID8499]NED37373.1 hypothetical protein [Streptomyces sp. SID8499]
MPAGFLIFSGKSSMLISVLVGLALTGCSAGGKKNYTVPEELCGASVAPRLTSDLLPAGDKLRVTPSHSGGPSPRQFCNVLVDGDIELTVEGVWRPSGTTAEQAASKELTFESRSTDGGRFALSDDKAFTVVDCANTDYKAGKYSFEVTVSHPDGDVGGKMQRFLAAFSESNARKLPCRR